MHSVTLIALVASVSATMPRMAGAASRAAAPVPAPETALGREIEMLLLALRSAIVLVPVGIVVAAVRRTRCAPTLQAAGACDACGLTEHAPDAAYCRRCGNRLMRARGTSAR